METTASRLIEIALCERQMLKEDPDSMQNKSLTRISGRKAKIKSYLIFRLQLRRLAAILGPAFFSIRTGHLLSSLAGKAMDSRGSPLPWYSYPAIRLLSQCDFSTATVLEFGGGQSTRWWSVRAKKVVVFDPHKPWADWLRSRVPKNVDVYHLRRCADAQALITGVKFEVIVVDAGSEEDAYGGRNDNMRTAMAHLAEGGMIVVDNSTADYCAALTDYAAADGWCRMDFIGFAPGGIKEYGTSIFYKKFPTFLSNIGPPRVILGS